MRIGIMGSVVWLAATVAASRPVASQDLGIAVGAKAPGATVETLDGRSADLGQYVGKKPLLLEFWATWCSNCKELEPRMLAAHKKYADRMEFVAVAVSFNQSPERVKLYTEKYGYHFDVLYDRHGSATDAYSVPATSYVVVVDRRGRVVYTGQGGDQDLEAAIARATP
ncbi:MAG: redoxin domain-containing protein [Gemmatimonadaceae bacterium]